jgi:hypothetical protein
MAVSKFSTNSLKTPLKYSSFLGGNAAFVDGAYESIATISVGSGGQTNIDFTNIPQTYKHLQIRGISRVTYSGGTIRSIYFQCGTGGTLDTTSKYSQHGLSTTADSFGAATANGRALGPEIVLGYAAAGGSTANSFGQLVIDILNYTNTDTYKTINSITGFVSSTGYGGAAMHSGNWQNTGAINTIRIFASGEDSAQYSRYALYGIKG